MNTVINLKQHEISEAVKDYVNDRISAGYRFELSELEVSFDTNQEDGNVSCQIYTEVERKETA